MNRCLTFLLLLVPFWVNAQNVTPAQYLASQPLPNFATNHHLPHLTQWNWGVSSNAIIELANNWGYTLTLGTYSTPSSVTNISAFNRRMLAMVSNNPAKYKLSVLIDRVFPSGLSSGFWCTNASGLFVDANTNAWPTLVYTNINGNWIYACSTNSNLRPIVSPEGSDDDWQAATAYWVNSLRVIQSNAPISIVLNGGEYGLDVQGFDGNAWLQDPRVQAATNGMSMPRYSSNRKAHQLGFLTIAINQVLPNRELYIFYNTGNEQSRSYIPGTYQTNWDNVTDVWGWRSDVMNTNTDLPSFEDYYIYNGSWTNNSYSLGQYDLLIRHLNGVGYDMALGYPRNYSWLCGGWSNTLTNHLSDIPTYTGFLKCLYTAGMVGGVAGYFATPTNTTPGSIFGGPGMDASFPPNSPPHWLQQIMALSHTHALFSHLEPFLTNGDLLSGPQHHVTSADQPAYEFTNTVARPYDRVLARKLHTANQWIVTAWAADGISTNVTVTIPTIGALTVAAVPDASVYRVTVNGATVTQTLLDEYTGPWTDPVPATITTGTLKINWNLILQ
jgi:hypothetical protein